MKASSTEMARNRRVPLRFGRALVECNLVTKMGKRVATCHRLAHRFLERNASRREQRDKVADCAMPVGEAQFGNRVLLCANVLRVFRLRGSDRDISGP